MVFMKKTIYNTLVILLDILFLICVFYISNFLRFNLNDYNLPNFKYLQIENFYFVFFIIVTLLYFSRIYSFSFDFWEETKKIFVATFFSFLIVLSILSITKNNFEYSRLFITIYFISISLFLPVFKRTVKNIIFSCSYFKKKVFIIGNKQQKAELIEELKKNWYLGLEYSEDDFDTVFIATKGLSKGRTNDYLQKYAFLHKDIFIIPYLTNINFANANFVQYTNIRYSLIHIENKLLIKSNTVIKSISEKLLTLLILPLFVLIHCILVYLIKKDSKGGVFFKQERLGQNGKIFKCYKYRTMYENGDEILKVYLQNNPDEVEYYGEFHKYKNDPRITKIGNILRKTSLDELPQVINVLKGEMNLVGPRPYMVTEKEKMGINCDIILKVKPAITGLWQVSGRNNLTFKQRYKLETWYINNWTLWLDVIILIKTIKVVLFKIGAK